MTDKKTKSLAAPFCAVIEEICSRNVRFHENSDNGEFILSVMPHLDDYRILIGTGGRQVKAFKYLFKIAAKNMGIEADIKFEEDFQVEEAPTLPRKRTGLNRERLGKLVGEIASMTMGCPVDIEQEQKDGKLNVKIFLHHETNDALHVISACNSIFYPYGKANQETVDVLYGRRE
jgi:predicted RNA-binding protein YlqC (UPF0109 family)